MARGSQKNTASGNFFDVTANFPGEGDSFAPNFGMKCRIAIEPRREGVAESQIIDGAGNIFCSADGKLVFQTVFLNRKGEQVSDKEGNLTRQINSNNYVIAESGEAHVWAYVKSERSLDGEIVNWKVGEYAQKNNKVVKTFELTIQDSDANERYRIDFRFNHTTRKFFNSLLSLGNNPAGIKLQIDLSQKKADNGVTYSNMYVKRFNDETGKFENLEWRFKKSAETGEWVDETGVIMPATEKEQTSFLLEELSAIEKTFVKADNSDGNGEDTSNGGDTAANDDEDIPF